MFATFSDFFFLKNRFLSDYVVAGCPKYIFGNFRNFLKNSEKKFSKFSPWALLMGPSKLSPMSNNHVFWGLRRPKIAHDPKIRFFQSLKGLPFISKKNTKKNFMVRAPISRTLKVMRNANQSQSFAKWKQKTYRQKKNFEVPQDIKPATSI